MISFYITERAALRISELIKNEEKYKLGMRVAVDGGGCAGFIYNYNLTDTADSKDFIIEKHGVKVIIDPISKPFLEGSKLDFIELLGSSYFQVTNPNITSRCGCGNSFQVKDS